MPTTELLQESKKTLIALANSPENNGLIGVDSLGNPIHLILRQSRGKKTLKEFGDLVGVSFSAIHHYEMLNIIPNDINMRRLANIVELNSNILFPPWLREFIYPKPLYTSSLEEVDESVVGRFDLLKAWTLVKQYKSSNIDPQEIVERRDFLDWVECQINDGSQFSSKETAVFTSYYGLSGKETRTGSEIGDEMGFNKSRSSQLLDSAERKLRERAGEVAEYGEGRIYSKPSPDSIIKNGRIPVNGSKLVVCSPDDIVDLRKSVYFISRS